MAKEDISRTVNELRRLAIACDSESTAARLRPLLQSDFVLWFRILKEQKLVSQFRSVAGIRELRSRLLGPEARLGFSTSQSTELTHHFDVCEFFQEIFAQIDAEAAAVPCCVAHPESLARAVVRMAEVANYALQRNLVPDIKSVPQRITTLQMSQIQRRFRDLLDTGDIILNSRVARNGTDRGHAIVDADLSELVRLALLYDEMRQALDHYTYGRAEVRINRRSLVVGRAERGADLASAVGSERTTDYDQLRVTLLTTLEIRVEKECRSIPVDGSVTFLGFLRKVGEGSAGDEARAFGRAFVTDLELELADFLDTATSVTTKSGTFTVGELIRAWAFLVSIAMLGQRWNERRADVGESGAAATNRKERETARIRDIPVPELKRRWLVRILSREAGLSLKQSRSLMDQFISRPAVGRIDLFYKPLLLLSDEVVLLPSPYIRGSRFERNLFALIATETDLDQKKKGYLPIARLQEGFKEAGFYALANFSVQIEHRELTDIDLVAFKDGILFLGQCKILIEPDTLYDGWKCERKLQFAGEQLNTCLGYLDKVRAALFERLGLRGQREERVVPFIITNTRQFTERSFCGHPVVDIPYLRFVLGGARGSIIATGPDGIGIAPGRSYIKGDKPNAAELATLLTRTFHRVREREVTCGHVMRKIGNRKVHLPTMTIRTAGDSHFLITDQEIFDKGRSAEPWLKHE